jgi:hypothetical protein
LYVVFLWNILRYLLFYWLCFIFDVYFIIRILLNSDYFNIYWFFHSYYSDFLSDRPEWSKKRLNDFDPSLKSTCNNFDYCYYSLYLFRFHLSFLLYLSLFNNYGFKLHFHHKYSNLSIYQIYLFNLFISSFIYFYQFYWISFLLPDFKYLIEFLLSEFVYFFLFNIFILFLLILCY